MMVLIALIMLCVPGLITVRILWRGKSIEATDYKFIVCDYLVYSFLILLMVYSVMFFSYPMRSVSLSVGVHAISHITAASFVFKYSFVALISSVVLPFAIPKIYKTWLNLEEGRTKRKEKN